MKEFLKVVNEFNKVPSLCNLFRVTSFDVWNRVGFVRSRTGLKIYETTLTQNIVYNFKVQSEMYPRLNIQIQEAINEPKDGNDLEFYLETDHGFILFAIQAKLLYKDYTYPKFDYRNQIDLLIDYANFRGGMPLYLLYNYAIRPSIQFSECGIDYGWEQYGCSMIDAFYIKETLKKNVLRKRGGVYKWIPSFDDLNPLHAFPWFKLVCCKDEHENFGGFLFELLNQPVSDGILKAISNIRFYTKEEILADDRWRDFEMVYNEPLKNRETEIKFRDNNTFTPRYRVVIKGGQKTKLDKLFGV